MNVSGGQKTQKLALDMIKKPGNVLIVRLGLTETDGMNCNKEGSSDGADEINEANTEHSRKKHKTTN